MAKLAWSLSPTKQQDLGPIIFAPLGLGLNRLQLRATERGATGSSNTGGGSHAGHIHQAWLVPLHMADMSSELSAFSVEDKPAPNILEGEHVYMMY